MFVKMFLILWKVFIHCFYESSMVKETDGIFQCGKAHQKKCIRAKKFEFKR